MTTLCVYIVLFLCKVPANLPRLNRVALKRCSIRSGGHCCGPGSGRAPAACRQLSSDFHTPGPPGRGGRTMEPAHPIKSAMDFQPPGLRAGGAAYPEEDRRGPAPPEPACWRSSRAWGAPCRSDQGAGLCSATEPTVGQNQVFKARDCGLTASDHLVQLFGYYRRGVT